MKYLVGIILIGAGIYLFHRIRGDNSLPDIPKLDCRYQSHGYEMCPCEECIERRGYNET